MNDRVKRLTGVAAMSATALAMAMGANAAGGGDSASTKMSEGTGKTETSYSCKSSVGSGKASVELSDDPGGVRVDIKDKDGKTSFVLLKTGPLEKGGSFSKVSPFSGSFFAPATGDLIIVSYDCTSTGVAADASIL